MRTHHCNQLRESHIGQTVTLIGWVNSARDHGGVIFIDLRDREGLTQCVFRPEENPLDASLSHTLREEDVVQVAGRVALRLEGSGNTRIPTGAIEIVVTALRIVNKADVLPFQLDKELSNEDMRMKYRYLDLRRARMSRNIRQRHTITSAARRYLDDAGFYEVETPILSNPTPEGARDFLVPSRLNPGRFYALPQAPQQYKQLETQKRDDILAEITKEVKRRATLEGYTLVVDKSGKTLNGIPSIIYYSSTADITEPVLTELNRGNPDSQKPAEIAK